MKKHPIRPVAVLSLLLALVLFTVSTVAWLTKEQTADQIYTALSDFDVDGVLTFGKETYTGTSILVPIGLSAGDNYIGDMKYSVTYRGISPAAIRVRILEQWIDIATGDLVSANYLNYHVTGTVTDLNPTGGTKLPAAGEKGTGGTANSILNPPGQWVDHRTTDFCYYYSVPVQPYQIVATEKTSPPGVDTFSQGTIQLDLIDQTLSSSNTAALIQGLDPKSIQLQLLFEVEAVQPNRIREFFGIDALPQPKPTQPTPIP